MGASGWQTAKYAMWGWNFGAAIPGLSPYMGSDNQKEGMQLPQTPTAPSSDEAASQAEKIAKKRRSSMTETIYTDPLGIQDQANVSRKTLLGQ
jgi:hypothetical protein